MFVSVNFKTAFVRTDKLPFISSTLLNKTIKKMLMELATSRFFGTTKGHKKERKFKYRTIDTIGHKKEKKKKEKRKEHNRKIPGGILRI
jgi:hypothetical protein